MDWAATLAEHIDKAGSDAKTQLVQIRQEQMPFVCGGTQMYRRWGIVGQTSPCILAGLDSKSVQNRPAPRTKQRAQFRLCDSNAIVTACEVHMHASCGAKRQLLVQLSSLRCMHRHTPGLLTISVKHREAVVAPQSCPQWRSEYQGAPGQQRCRPWHPRAAAWS